MHQSQVTVFTPPAPPLPPATGLALSHDSILPEAQPVDWYENDRLLIDFAHVSAWRVIPDGIHTTGTYLRVSMDGGHVIEFSGTRFDEADDFMRAYRAWKRSRRVS